MTFFTVRTGASFDGTSRKAVEDAVLSRGGAVLWHDGGAFERTYALVEAPVEARVTAAEVGRLFGGDATVYEGALVAVAIVPAHAAGIPALVDAFGGAGRPAGMVTCEASAGAAILEWDPSATAPETVWNLVDAELERYGSGRCATLLSPLPADVTAAIAARGLQAPEIGPERVIETLLERAGLQ
ncbi:MAG: hypothetical protein JO199_10785 [Candidatus Eremiobacteraeota bacterium]|nr:hypothetical protein [Candidatus Eremiobacteraeota bacterium]